MLGAVKHWHIPLDRPVTHITRPAKGPFDRTKTDSDPAEDVTVDIGSKDCKPLKEGIEAESPTNSLEQPLLLITSTLPSLPIINSSNLSLNL